MQSGDDSLWESFPHTLETLEGARRYINAFQAPFQELTTLSQQQVYALRACSLLAIPPPTEGEPPQGGFPTELTELNFSGWATLVQDVAAGLQALPPNLSRDMGLTVVALLQLLEVATGVGFLPPLLQPGAPMQVCGNLPVSSSHIVEPDHGADSGVWSDHLLWRHDHSSYLGGGNAWICGTSAGPHPSRSLHLESAPSGDPSTQGTTCSFMIPISHWEVQTAEYHSGKVHLGAAGAGSAGSTSSGPAGSDAACPGTAYSSGGTTPLSATTPPASNSIPTSSTATRPVYWSGSHF